MEGAKNDQTLLLVSDMTSRVNWGARGASLALQEMLDEVCGTLRTLPSTYADDGQVVIDPVLPETVAKPLLYRRGKNALFDLYFRLEERMGMSFDYVEPSPSESAQNIVEHKQKDGIAPIYRSVDEADEVVVDGDGDLIFREHPGRIVRFNLALIELARRFDTPVHYVNSIFSDCPATGRNESLFDQAVAALRKCETVSLRDPESVRLAETEAPGLDVAYAPDSLFHWYERSQDAQENLPASGDYAVPYPRERPSRLGSIRFDEPYLCVSGGSRASWNPEEAVAPYVQLVEELKHLDLSVYLTPAGSGDSFLYDVADATDTPIVPAETPIRMAGAILSEAEAFVTGRYHPAILASLGGTPCVFLGADSHKTRSLQDVLGYEETRLFSALPTVEEAKDIVALIRRYLRAGSDLRADITSAARKAAERARSVTDAIGGSSSLSS
mgnify:FL=1